MKIVLEGKNLTKNFGGVRALSSCSFAVEKKTITALIGPNGGGKTTLFNAIAHLIDLDHGHIFLEEYDLTKMPDFAIARVGVSRTFQEVRLFKNLTIGDHIKIALATGDEHLFRSCDTCTQERMHEILTQVQLHKSTETIVTDLSYGQRKLLDLALALAHPHKILLLDEPVAGVNPQVREDIKTILRNLNAKGETIFLIEHNMNFVMDLADHVLVMDAGSVIAEGPPNIIKKNPLVLEAYLGRN